ncbi:MAG: hypothetical protein HY328_09345 [Chloroflexi bacterium]|nr:hypothetical protein [Chloroflexota bacterium]
MKRTIQRRMFAGLGIGLALAMVLYPLRASAAGEGNEELQLFAMGSGLLGGLAIFLFGMEQMSEAIRIVAGLRMRDIFG